MNEYINKTLHLYYMETSGSIRILAFFKESDMSNFNGSYLRFYLEFLKTDFTIRKLKYFSITIFKKPIFAYGDSSRLSRWNT